MAYSIIHKPGSELGPCVGEAFKVPISCGHVDCEASRRTALETCRECGKPIGYETKYARAGNGLLMHWLCLLAAADRKDAATPTPEPRR